MSDEARDQNLEIVNLDDSRGGSFGSVREPLGVQDDSQAPNPIKMVLDRMHGRWLWAIILGVVLSPIFAYVGYKIGPVLYESTAFLTVDARLETLVEVTPETREIKVDQEVQEQAQLLRGAEVLYEAVKLMEPTWGGTYPNLAERVKKNLMVSVPRGAALILVKVSDPNPAFAKDAVNAIVDAYWAAYVPDTERQHGEKMREINTAIEASRRDIKFNKEQRVQLLRDSQYAITDVNSIISSNVERIRRLEVQLMDIDDRMNRINEAVIVKQQLESSEPVTEYDPPQPDDRLEPSIEDLAEVDPELPRIRESLARSEVAFGLVSEQFGKAHMQYRRTKSNLEAQQSSYNARLEAARQTWVSGVGKDYTWGALGLRRQTLNEDVQNFRAQNTQLALDMIAAEDLESQIESEMAELQLLSERYNELDRERDAIRGGRVSIASRADLARFPSTDKKGTFALAGAFAGIAGSLSLFFLIGTIDQKTFGIRQLEDHQNTMRVLGVMPDMDEVENEADSVMLATDCVHRIRARIESRRAPERGYALMVSSPFQGDGKTTLAVSLGWSYAESGYKTLLIDADFIGRAMSHQFGHLKDPGLREIIRNGEVQDEIHELGHPNLSLLSVGFDRRISAANLSPRLMSRVLEAVRDEYDLVIIDSGPITASIEAMPVASASDGVVLTLRRGRSRGRLAECVADIRSVGADYIGVVLNYANRTDCLRHGSTSRMSVSVQAALEGGDTEALPQSKHPLIEGLGSRED